MCENGGMPVGADGVPTDEVVRARDDPRSMFWATGPETFSVWVGIIDGWVRIYLLIRTTWRSCQMWNLRFMKWGVFFPTPRMWRVTVCALLEITRF